MLKRLGITGSLAVVVTVLLGPGSVIAASNSHEIDVAYKDCLSANGIFILMKATAISYGKSAADKLQVNTTLQEYRKGTWKQARYAYLDHTESISFVPGGTDHNITSDASWRVSTTNVPQRLVMHFSGWSGDTMLWREAVRSKPCG